MSKIKLITLLCCFVSIGVFSQSTINYEGQTINMIDKDGKKTGIWKLFDKKRDIMVVAKMENDVFVSHIEYYQKGKLMVSQHKDINGEYTFYIDSKPVPIKTIKGNDKYITVKDNGEELDKETQQLFFGIMNIEALFYGNVSALPNFLNNEMNKKQWDHSGRVRLGWTVNKNGLVEDIKVIKSDDPVLNEDAIRIIEKMPRWQPAFQRGKFVMSKLNTSLSFNNM